MTNGGKFKEVFGFGADGSRVIAVNKTWWDCEFQNSKPITNADRIKSMTDEELAEYLFIKTCEDGFPQFTTKNDWLDWLKKEN